jgi:hypothetical protein
MANGGVIPEHSVGMPGQFGPPRPAVLPGQFGTPQSRQLRPAPLPSPQFMQQPMQQQPMQQQPMQQQPMQQQPMQQQPQNNLAQTAANTYNTAIGATAQGMGFTPNQVTPNTVAGTDMQQYQNPFQQQVIDASMADMNRANQMALNNVGAQAGSSFGGDRHAIAEAETNRNFANRAAQMTAGLNQAGYQNAQNMAQFDIGNNFAAQNQNNANNFAANQNLMGGANQLANLSQQGFGYNQQINEGVANTGNAQQNLMQQIINSANGQFGDITGYGQNMLNLPLAAVGGAQFPTQQTNTRQPGLFDYLTLGATARGR